MDGRIRQLNCQLHAPATIPHTRLNHLKELLVLSVIEQYSQALDAALGQDSSVYVLRQVDCTLTLPLTDQFTDAAISTWLGERLAGAVMHSIVRADQQCVQYPSQAAYSASYLADLLRGTAHGCWYYAAFARFEHLPLPMALHALLLDQPKQLPAILAILASQRLLDQVLAVLPRAALAELWQCLGPQPTSSVDDAAIFLSQAIQLIDHLAYWAGGRPTTDLRAAYAASQPPVADWRSRQSLTEAVLHALAFLQHQGLLCHESDSSGLLQRLDQVLASFDWLDLPMLRERIPGLLALDRLTPVVPVRPRTGATPRQQALLTALNQILQVQAHHLDASQPHSAANALRLYSWLNDQHADLANDALTHKLITALLQAWEACLHTTRPAALAQALGRQQLAAACSLLAEQQRDQANTSLQLLFKLGPPAIQLLTQLLPEAATSVGSAQPGDSLPTAYAGAALLFRTILDLRLPAALHNSGLLAELSREERLRLLLVLLIYRWYADPPPADLIDPGLARLLGWEAHTLPLPANLVQHWPATFEPYEQFQANCLATLWGQRMLAGDNLALHLVEYGTGNQALIGGDIASGIWPLATLVRDPDELPAIMQRWIMLWVDRTGQAPTILSGPELRPYLPLDAIASDQPLAHQASRERLLAALATLGSQPGVLTPLADLTITITALTVLRSWCRWMRQFGDSSAGYLLKQFIRRPGRAQEQPDRLLVELAGLPLDMVLQMSGYLANLERVPWLGGRTLHFSIQK